MAWLSVFRILRERLWKFNVNPQKTLLNCGSPASCVVCNDAGVAYNFSKLLDSPKMANISTREDTLRCNYCFLLITRSKLYLWRDKKIVLLLVYMYT